MQPFRQLNGLGGWMAETRNHSGQAGLQAFAHYVGAESGHAGQQSRGPGHALTLEDLEHCLELFAGCQGKAIELPAEARHTGCMLPQSLARNGTVALIEAHCLARL